MKDNIPEEFKIKEPIYHDTFLINGKIGKWKGEFTDVISTLLSEHKDAD